MDINTVQQSAFQRQVNPARGTDQRHREQDRAMQDQLQEAEARQRAEDKNRQQQQQQEWLRPERRLDGRLVRVGSSQQEAGDTEEARSNMMRQKIARTYSASESSAMSRNAEEAHARQAESSEQTARSVARDNIDFVV